ncbi:MAG: carbohydrate-binding domain-containing protein [Sphaerochaetaceae bacterium]|nr:carbohydrate-binding domain-containing protein [Sphaerochaetaceae bacterium]
MKRKHFDLIAVLVMVFAVLLTVVFMNGSRLGLTAVTDEDSEAHSDDTYFTANDLNGAWDASSAAVITLNGDSAVISGYGAYVNGNSVVIASSGKYVVSGSFNGQLAVDSNDNAKIWILFDGVEIYCEDDAAFVNENSDKVFLTLADGSVNYLSSGSSFSEEALEENTDATLFSRDDLTINGSGTLTVSGNYKHAIEANDDLVITGGNLILDAVKDGINVNDSLRICNSAITIEAGDDGMATTGEDSYVYIESGTIVINCTDEGILSEGDVILAGGSINISTDKASGHHAVKAAGTCTVTGGEITFSECYEGIQASCIDIYDGNLLIYSYDDALNASNGTTTDMFSMDMGMGMKMDHEAFSFNSDSSERPERGERTAPDAEEKTEMLTEEQSAALEEGSRSFGPMQATEEPEAETEATATESEELPWIHVNGGTITVINSEAQDADGFDSNGSIEISGGTVLISLSGTGSNNAIDYGSESGGTCTVTGGTVIACGSYSMAEGFDSSSSQCSIMYTISGGVEAGTAVSLLDSEGNTLLSWTVPCSFSCVTLSCPEMKLNETYTVVIGNYSEKVTLTEVSFSYGDAQSSMFGGSFSMSSGMQDFGGGSFPDRSSEDGEIPEPPEGMPETGDFSERSASMQNMGWHEIEQDTSEEADDAVEIAGTEEEETYTTETLILISVSLVLLLAALIFVKKFRKY